MFRSFRFNYFCLKKSGLLILYKNRKKLHQKLSTLMTMSLNVENEKVVMDTQDIQEVQFNTPTRLIELRDQANKLEKKRVRDDTDSAEKVTKRMLFNKNENFTLQDLKDLVIDLESEIEEYRKDFAEQNQLIKELISITTDIETTKDCMDNKVMKMESDFKKLETRISNLECGNEKTNKSFDWKAA
ncbi:hypothetical protein BpHYR1_052734, partial [Brachionus plicatilis]